MRATRVSLAGVLLAAWTGSGLALFLDSGLARVREDAAIGALGDARLQRRAVWPESAPAFELLDSALERARNAGHARILMLAGPGSGLVTAAAVHDLYPTQVLIRDPARMPEQTIEQAGRAVGAEAVLFQAATGAWRLQTLADGG